MKPLLYAFTLTALGGCFYTETPYGRTAVLDLPDYEIGRASCRERV